MKGLAFYYLATATRLASCFWFWSLFDFVTGHETELNGTHLIVSGINSLAGFNLIRNASGYIVKVDAMGPLMLSWLSQYYNFTYSILQVNDTSLDATANQRGLISYLLNGECQLLLSVTPTYSRARVLDFSHPNLYVPVSYLIPKWDSSINITAAANPFHYVVWLALIASLACILLLLYLFRRIARQINSGPEITKDGEKKSPSWNTSFYVLGTLLSQGGYMPYNSLPSFYLVSGVWCFVAFVFVNAYNTTLISHITLPNPQPLIKTIYDLRNRTDIHLITDRNLNTDAVLSAADSGFLKILGDKLRDYPKSRCNSTKECIKLVKSGFHVYSSGMNSFLYGAMREDYLATGQCNLNLQKESYMNLPISMALPKGSQHMESFNLGIMRMREAGLLNTWNKKFIPDARQCMTPEKKKTLNPLKLKHFSSAFVVLAIGFVMSFTVFVGEKFVFRMQSTKRQLMKK